VRATRSHDRTSMCELDRSGAGCEAPRRVSGQPSSSEGEGGCLFDEIQDFVEPTERPHTEVRAGLTSHGRPALPERLDPTKKCLCWTDPEGAEFVSFGISEICGVECLRPFFAAYSRCALIRSAQS
jgi:hypothetical protein